MRRGLPRSSSQRLKMSTLARYPPAWCKYTPNADIRVRPAPIPVTHLCLRASRQWQCQADRRTSAAAFPFDLAAELLGEVLDQQGTEARIGALRIDSLAIISDRQEKPPILALERHQHQALCVGLKGILDGICDELVHNEPNRNRSVDRQEFTSNVGLERNRHTTVLH